LEGYILRKGDMIIAGEHAGVITKTTPRYIYYYLSGSIARVKKESVWSYFDTKSEVTLKYGSTSRRRPQRRMRTLDLHGVRHADVDEKLRSFLNFVELPCKVVTGKSSQMKAIVEAVVKEYDWACHDPWNAGAIVVTEK
jgi:hypothetical protein